ncbi:MAG: FAD-dependent oxidoreductase [Planctomycetaceae bacterium]
MKLLIVGGVAAGASAAARARRLSEQAQIILIERGPDVSFANCGMPYYIGGEIQDRQKLKVVTPELLRTRFRLDVRTGTEVLTIDPQSKTLRLRDLATGTETEETYDKLLLTPGASPLRPPIPGLDLPGIFTLRNLQDMDAIRAASERDVQEAVVVGAGFIGLELVENFVKRGIRTTLVELLDQVLPPLDKELTTPILQELKAHGVRVILGRSAQSFQATAKGLAVQLPDGEQLSAQLVVLGIGVRPENKLAVDAGLDVGPRGGIRVDATMRTSDPDIFAAGDVIETRCDVTGESTQMPLAGPANRQGRIAADNIMGRASQFRGVQGTAIVGVFNKTAAMTGQSEKSLRRIGLPYKKVYVHPSHHAGYYPGATPMTLKVMFDPETGRILGAQGVGGDGVDKRIDVLAVAIQAKLTVYDLEQLELCYAPQYGSAKDPVNMVGFVAAGMLQGTHPQIDIDDILTLPEADRPFLLDVRTPAEFAAGHIPNSINIPVDDLRNRLEELPKNREIAAYCKVGQRGYIATRILLQHGYPTKNLSGGYTTYTHKYPEE